MTKKYTNITIDQLKFIKHYQKSLLFYSKTVRLKKGSEETFGVILGRYDGADICYLVGMYKLSKQAKIINNK